MANDRYLLENNLNERAITHKLAEYYQLLFREWNVDCEYNRNLGKPKELTIDPKQLLAQMAGRLSKLAPEINRRLRDDISEEEIKELEKQLKDPKIEYVEELDLYLFLLSIKDEVIQKTIYPDIIIHKRGTKENLIVIEAKKSTNKNRVSRFYDLLKLATLTTLPEYKYRQGVFIDIPVGNDLLNFKFFSRYRSSFPKVYQYLPKYT